MRAASLAQESMRRTPSREQCQSYASTLKKMVDCKTVFKRDGSNAAEFSRFYNVIDQSFPLLSARAERLSFGSGCFVYRIKGGQAKHTVMLMSHHDVVDGGEGWDSDPFCAVEKDGYLYGRGTIDTKTPLFAQLQACEELLQEGYDFSAVDLYIGSSNNEEVCGDGMVLAEEYFRSQGLRFDMILDEGGAITQGMIPGVSAKSAMVAVHEKSRHLYRCTASLSTQGHGGLAPSEDSVVNRMSAFIQEVQKSRIYKGGFSPEVKATFQSHAPYMSFPLSFLFAHLGFFSPIIKKIMLGIPQARAMLSTSIAFNGFFAGSREDPQIRPKTAEANMFLRCVREDDLYRGLEKIKQIADKHGVTIEEIERDYCRPTDFTAEPFRLVEELLHENFPDVIVAPFLLTAGTDARRFTDIADSILRFAPIDLDKSQFNSIHDANEHIKIENVGQCVLFYKDLIKRLK